MPPFVQRGRLVIIESTMSNRANFFRPKGSDVFPYAAVKAWLAAQPEMDLYPLDNRDFLATLERNGAPAEKIAEVRRQQDWHVDFKQDTAPGLWGALMEGMCTFLLRDETHTVQCLPVLEAAAAELGVRLYVRGPSGRNARWLVGEPD